MASKQGSDGVRELFAKFLDIAYELALLCASVTALAIGLACAAGVWICNGIKDTSDRLLQEKRDKDRNIRYVKNVGDWKVPQNEEVTHGNKSP